MPARVHKAKIRGTTQGKLDALRGLATLGDLTWVECSRDWDAPFYAVGASAYFNSPKVTDIFPWQHSGVQMKRTWPVGETPGLLEERWRRFTDSDVHGRRSAFRETRDRKIDRRYPNLVTGTR